MCFQYIPSFRSEILQTSLHLRRGVQRYSSQRQEPYDYCLIWLDKTMLPLNWRTVLNRVTDRILQLAATTSTPPELKNFGVFFNFKPYKRFLILKRA